MSIRRVWIVTCAWCDLEGRFAGESDQIFHRLERDGWSVKMGGSETICPKCLEQRDPKAVTADRWRWELREDAEGTRYHSLVSPDGLLAASVYEGVGPAAGSYSQPRELWRADGSLYGWYWSLWNPDGMGGENDREDTLDEAKWCADRGARVWWYEQGWATPRRAGR